MKRIILMFCLALTMAASSWAQRTTDILDRGLVAIPANTNWGSNNGNFVSWRQFGEEYYGVTYNLYRGGTRIASNLKVSNFLDTSGTTASSYQVAPVVRGVEGAKCKAVTCWAAGYYDIPVASVVDRNGNECTSEYIINDISLGDVDGDGVSEFIVKRNYTGDILAADNTTKFHHYEVYNMAGKRLWWIDMGPNMMAEADEQWDIVAYDWDEDGRCECLFRGADNMIIHTASGSIINVGNMSYVAPRTSYTADGAEYLLYVEGATGQPYPIGTGDALWMTYPLPRGADSDWGSGVYGHRSTKHYFGAPFLDGRHASIFLGRGCYTKHHFKAFDVDPKTHKLTMRWEWRADSGPYFGCGYHNYGIADVDWDGRDEIVFGSMVVDDNGKGLHTTGLGHGDAQHCSDFDPYRHGQEFFACNESSPAMNYRNATTGKMYYRLQSTGDDGRALCGNFSNDYPGAIGHSSQSGTISCVSDKVIADLGGYDLNFRIYWDGDLCEEIVNSPGTERDAKIDKFGVGRIFLSTGCQMCNWTKNTPSAMGDIIGDWREELILRADDNTKIRIYTTPHPTEHRIYSLWHDHQYRQGMVWECIGYNQPPHASFFIGELEGITMAPPPFTMTGRTEIANGGTIGTAQNDKQVIVCETNDTEVSVQEGASPYVMFFNVPSWVQGTNATATDGTGKINYKYYTCTVNGGAFGGGMRLVKQGDGILNLPNVEQKYTGPTDIWAGTLNFDGKLLQSSLWLNRFAELNSSGGEFRRIKMDYDAKLRPGGASNIGTVTTDSLLLGFGSRVVFDLDLEQSAADQLNIGVLTLETKNWEYGPQYQSPVFEFVVPRGQELQEGQYQLGTVTTLVGTLGDIRIEGMSTKMKSSLLLENGILYLVISETRLAGSIIWNGNSSNVWDFANAQNFTLASNPEVTDETFVTGDKVLFPSGTGKYTVSLQGDLEADSVIVDGAFNYTFNGTGSIVGKSTLVKRGKGTLTISTDNSYTGGTRISGGTVSVKSLSNSTQAKGNLGGVTTQPRRFIIENGATLKTTAAVIQGSPMYMMTEDGGVIDNSADFVVNSAISGTKLTKQGNGWMKLNVVNTALNRLVVSAGTVQCVNCNTPAKVVELAGGTLSENTGTSYTIEVTGRKTSYWNLVERAAYANRLLGTGTVQIYLPSVVGSGWMATRTPINGDWSQFEGTVIPSVNSKDGETRWTLNNSYGMPKGAFDIPSGIVVTNSGKTYRIGKVTGAGALGGYCTFDNNGGSGVNTWEVGSNETSYAMDTKVTGGATRFVKVGTGRVSVKAKWDITGDVTVAEGNLAVTNTACLGTGTVTVNEGATLSGTTGTNALTNSAYTINGTLLVGNNENDARSTLNFGGQNVTINSTGRLTMAVNRGTTDDNACGSTLTNIGRFTFNGTLAVNVPAANILAEGDVCVLWTANSFSGTPMLENYIIDASQGLVWDATDLHQGILRVKYDPATNIEAKYNQRHTDDAVVYDLNGRRVKHPAKGLYIVNGRRVLLK